VVPIIMTRINLVDVEDLSDQHLFAEWREMVRIPTAVRKLNGQQFTGIPDTYRMGAGHVKFFYNKLNFLHERYQQLTQELMTRNFKITIRDEDEVFFSGIVQRNQVPWEPSKEEIEISAERISVRLREKPKLHRYFGEHRDPEFFIARYK
jgi:deoxyribonuclease (pyrimidine dimer)